MRWLPLLLVPLAGCFGAAPDVAQPTPGDATGWALEEAWSGFDQPVLVTHDGEATYVVEQCGQIHRIDDGALWLDVADRIACGGERGLLGLAFPPDARATGRSYLSYTDRDGDSVLSRWSDLEAPAGEEVLMRVEQPASNHNGGHLAFGPDGMLYWGLGDGGGAGDTYRNGQDKRTVLGTILRLDVSGGTATAPPDNPFVGAEGDDRIWAYGLRNPWRFSFDEEGALWIGDVGQNAWEEIDRLEPGQAGANLGWPIWEGAHRFSPGTAPGAVFPVAEYSSQGDCSVTGGHVYDGPIASLQGVYLLGDYCSGMLRGVEADGDEWRIRDLLDTDLRITSFGHDADGALYVVDHGGGVHRFMAT